MTRQEELEELGIEEEEDFVPPVEEAPRAPEDDYWCGTVGVDYWQLSSLRKRPPPIWLHENFVLERAITILYAPSNNGKTFVGLWSALTVARNYGLVIWVAAEGQDDVAPRTEAWCRTHGIAFSDLDNQFLAVLNPIDLANGSQLALWGQELAKLGPRLIVFDTLSLCYGGLNPNDTQDTVRVFGNLRSLIQTCGASIMLIDHAGHDESHLRGASAKLDNSNLVIKLKWDAKTTRKTLINVTYDKMKSFSKPTDFNLELKAAPTYNGSQLAVWKREDITERDISEIPVPKQQTKAKAEKLKKVLFVLRVQFPEGARITDIRTAMIKREGTEDGWSFQTCKRHLEDLAGAGDIYRSAGGDEAATWHLIVKPEASKFQEAGASTSNFQGSKEPWMEVDGGTANGTAGGTASGSEIRGRNDDDLQPSLEEEVKNAMKREGLDESDS